MLLRELTGRTLRAERRAQARSLRSVADDAGVSMGYLSEVERGVKEPSSEVLAAVCRALDLELADLLGGVLVQLRPVPAVVAAPAPSPLAAPRPHEGLVRAA
ncbi:hypothetical protein GCM10027047_05010 [Rhodococcus aerolatus]